MKKWMLKQNALIRFILLFIPITGWIIEIVVRFEEYAKHHSLLNLILAIVSIFGLGAIFGWIDIICVVFFKHFFLTK